MKAPFRAAAIYIKNNRPIYNSAQINNFCVIYKNEDPSFDEDLFKRYVNGECGINGGKIKKSKPKHMIYDGLDLSEMVEGEE